MKYLKKLYVQIILATLAGIALGHFWPEFGSQLKPVGDLFIFLLKMIVAPLIFCVIVTGIASMNDIKKVGKTGLHAFIYFELLTTLALILGLFIMNVLEVGKGMNIDIHALNTEKLQKLIENAPTNASFFDYLTGLIPHSFFAPFTSGSVTQTLFIAILFGIALQQQGGKSNILFPYIEQANNIFFNIVEKIMYVAPIGAFGAMAFSVGKFGISALIGLGQFVAVFFLACLIFTVFVTGGFAKYYKIPFWRVVSYMKDEIFIVIGGGSSEPVFAVTLKKLEKLGAKRETVGLVLPAGYSLNLDGSCMYLTACAVFLANATNTPFPLHEQISLLLILLVASKGTAAIYGSAFVILGSVLASSSHIPVESLALILGIDRFMAIARATTNYIGNVFATLVIAAHNQELDHQEMAIELIKYQRS